MIRSAAALLGTLALAACTAGTGDLGANLNRVGGPAGSGGVCAYYAGATGQGRRSPLATFRRRACFSTAAACQRWLYEVQSRYPVRQFSDPCR